MSYEQREPRGDRAERGERGERPQGGKSAGGKTGGFFRRRKTCPFSGENAPKIDWKDTKTLGRYISERGKIMPARITAVSTKKQRELAQAIKRARFMALMPYVRDELPAPRFAPSGERGERFGGDRGDRFNSDRGEGRSFERGDRPERTERQA